MLKIPTLLAAIAVLGLGAWFLQGTLANQALQRALQNQQDDIQARQLAIQNIQQTLQLQQQRIDAASQLANQTGPALIRDLAELQLAKNNLSIARILRKYGITATPDQPSTPSKKN